MLLCWLRRPADIANYIKQHQAEQVRSVPVGPDRGHDVARAASGRPTQVAEGAQDAAEKVSDAAHEAADRVGEAAGAAKQAVGRLLGRLTGRMSGPTAHSPEEAPALPGMPSAVAWYRSTGRAALQVTLIGVAVFVVYAVLRVARR